MARPHHRKKHKEHLRQFKHKDETNVAIPKTKAASILAVVGAIFGLAVSFIATQGDILWMSVGFIVCSVAGYFIGRSIDNSKE